MNKTFDYDQFLALDGLALVDYSDPLLNDVLNGRPVTVTQDVCEKMVSELPHFNAYHLVYALELGAERCPGMFVAHVPRYLAHEDSAVCCAAVRVLDRLPDEWLTAELVDSVRTVLASRSVRTFVREILGRLQKRLVLLS